MLTKSLLVRANIFKVVFSPNANVCASKVFKLQEHLKIILHANNYILY